MNEQAMQNAIQSALPDVSAEDLAEITIDFIRNGKTLSELKGLTHDQLETIYAMAYSVYSSGDYEKALKIFRFLCFFDHLEKNYWLGLGGCLQMLKEYEQAIEAYSNSMMLDSENPAIPLLAAECHLALDHKEQAISGLTAAIEWSGTLPDHVAVRDRAVSLLELVNASANATVDEAQS